MFEYSDKYDANIVVYDHCVICFGQGFNKNALSNHKALADRLANAYKKEVKRIIELLADDINEYYGIDYSLEEIKLHLGKPAIFADYEAIYFYDQSFESNVVITIDFFDYDLKEVNYVSYEPYNP